MSVILTVNAINLQRQLQILPNNYINNTINYNLISIMTATIIKLIITITITIYNHLIITINLHSQYFE